MSSDDFGSQVQSYAGQTDMAPYISLFDQRQILVPRFAASHAEVGNRIETFLNRKALCIRESRTLTALRDALLPKLLSGGLRMPDAERIVGRCV
jgi:type I restriction enzyme S subunit